MGGHDRELRRGFQVTRLGVFFSTPSQNSELDIIIPSALSSQTFPQPRHSRLVALRLCRED
jgi:hypothetical protein